MADEEQSRILRSIQTLRDRSSMHSLRSCDACAIDEKEEKEEEEEEEEDDGGNEQEIGAANKKSSSDVFY